MTQHRCANRFPIETLEPRRLMAWGAAPALIDQDVAAANFPNITGTGVTVAVMDTGVDYNHPALGGGFGAGKKVKAGYDFVDNDGDPMDTFGHGTNTTGIIAANEFTIDGNTYRGVAPSASIVALRIAAGGEPVTDATIERALQWIEQNRVTHNISVVNFSFGAGRHTSPLSNATVSDEFKRLADAGVIFTSPSGNDGGTGINWPAADPSVVSVGSVGTGDAISGFTQRGGLLDLLAPGEGVGTTNRGGGFGLVTLTSFSSPIAAGAAALIKQANPTANGKDILSILRASGVRKDEGNTFYSRIDLDNALTLALKRSFNPATDVGLNAESNDLAFDKYGVLHFAYYDPTVKNIKYATRSTAGFWSATETIDKSGNDVGATMSLALDPTGKPSIAYYDNSEGDLEYARFDGIAWKRSTLDSLKTTGQFPSLAFQTNGHPIVAYFRKTSRDLRFSRSDGVSWTRGSVDVEGDVGRFASIAVSKNNTIGAAYVDTTNGDVKYAQYNSGTNTWTPELVHDTISTAFLSLAFNNSNQPAISYYDASPANLEFATKSSGAWVHSTVAARGAVGQFTNLWFDNTNAANIVYYSRKANALYHVWGTAPAWSAAELRLNGGTLAVATPTVDGTAAAYSWWDPAKNKLMTGDIL
jgi:hypothetical protein